MIPQDERERILGIIGRVDSSTLLDHVKMAITHWRRFKEKVHSQWARTPEQVSVLLLEIYKTPQWKSFRKERWRRTQKTATYKTKNARQHKAAYKKDPAKFRDRRRARYFAKLGIKPEDIPPKRPYRKA